MRLLLGDGGRGRPPSHVNCPNPEWGRRRRGPRRRRPHSGFGQLTWEGGRPRPPSPRSKRIVFRQKRQGDTPPPALCPGSGECRLLFVAGDAVALLERQADIVEAVEQGVLAERVDL